jgi:hypothetical protein
MVFFIYLNLILSIAYLKIKPIYRTKIITMPITKRDRIVIQLEDHVGYVTVKISHWINDTCNKITIIISVDFYCHIISVVL